MSWRASDSAYPYGYSGYRTIEIASDSAGPYYEYSDYRSINDARDSVDPYGYSAYRTTSNVTDSVDPYGYSAYRTVRSERRLNFSSDAARAGGDGPRFSTFNDKSQAAIRREREAKARFNEVKMDIEGKTDVSPYSDHAIQLLEPSCHLTAACYATFRQYVAQNPGWSVRRRVATPEEKRQSGAKRKSRVYFVYVTYTVPKSGDSTKSITSETNNTDVNTDFEKETKLTGLKVRVDNDGTSAGPNVGVKNAKHIENVKQASSSLIKATPVVSTSADRRVPAEIQENGKENVPLSATDA